MITNDLNIKIIGILKVEKNSKKKLRENKFK